MIEGGEDLRDSAIGGEHTDEFGRQFDPFSGDYFIGNFPAEFEALHIRNPQPGYRYYHAVNPEKDGGSNLLHLMNTYGAELIANDDPEHIGLGRAHSFQTHNGSLRAFGDVVAVRMLQSTYDEARRRERESYNHSLDGVVAEYKDRDPLNNGQPTRYVGAQHGTRVEDL